MAQSPPVPERLRGDGVMKPHSTVLPIDSRLLAMRNAGFSFETNRDGAGLILALVGVRVHDGVIDVVQLYGEDDADAVRVPDDEPDIMFPRTVLWRTTGSATDVIDQLLELPPPAPNP